MKFRDLFRSFIKTVTDNEFQEFFASRELHNVITWLSQNTILLELSAHASYHFQFRNKPKMIHLINQHCVVLFYPFCSKQQQKISLIGNNGSPKPQIVKTNPAHVEAQTDKKERGKAFRQVLAAFVANIASLNTGLIFGFSAVVIPQLQAASSSIPIDESQTSWIGKSSIELN